MKRFEKYLGVLVLGGLIFSTSVVYANGQQEEPIMTEAIEELEEAEDLNEAEGLLDDDMDAVEEMQLVEAEGVLITNLFEDSAATKAGLMRGDIILAVNGENVVDINEITEAISDLAHGDMITLSVSRGGEKIEVPLTLETRIGWPLIGIYGAGPREGRAQSGNRNDLDWDELFENLDEEGFRFQRTPGEQGHGFMMTEDFPEEVMTAFEEGNVAMVTDITADSPAEASGVLPSAVIIAVDGEPLADGDLKSAVLAYNSGDTITLRVFQDEEVKDIEVTLGDSDGNPLLGVTYSAMGQQMRNQFQDDRMQFDGQNGNRPKGMRNNNIAPTDG